MKINKPALIGYFCIFALFIAFSVIFEQPVMLLFLFVFVVIFPVSIISVKKATAKYSFFLSPKSEYVEFPNDAVFMFSYKRSFGLPLFNGEISFTCENKYFPNDIKRTLSVPLTKKSNSFLIPINESEIGLISLKITQIVISDYTGLFKVVIPSSLEAGIPVFPEAGKTREIPMITPKEGLDEFVESDANGNVSSDVKEIREYRPGDRLQRIHWKLSAKLDDLFVKEMSNTSTLSIILLPELDKDSIGKTIATLVSTVNGLIEEKIRFEICVFNSKACDFSYFTVTDEDELAVALTYLYCQSLYDGKNYALDTYLASTQRESTVIHICGKRIDIGE